MAAWPPAWGCGAHRYLELGRYEEALEMTNHSLRVRVTTLGKHNNTDATVRNALDQVGPARLTR